jgi:hypothetical protein
MAKVKFSGLKKGFPFPVAYVSSGPAVAVEIDETWGKYMPLPGNGFPVTEGSYTLPDPDFGDKTPPDKKVPRNEAPFQRQQSPLNKDFIVPAHGFRLVINRGK